jgi:hypothetical protein
MQTKSCYRGRVVQCLVYRAEMLVKERNSSLGNRQTQGMFPAFACSILDTASCYTNMMGSLRDMECLHESLILTF